MTQSLKADALKMFNALWASIEKHMGVDPDCAHWPEIIRQAIIAGPDQEKIRNTPLYKLDGAIAEIEETIRLSGKHNPDFMDQSAWETILDYAKNQHQGNQPDGPAADALDTLMLIMNAHCESNDIDMPDDEDGAMVRACVRDIKQANDVDSFRESLIKEFTRLKSGQSVRDELYLAGVIAVIQTHGKEDEQP